MKQCTECEFIAKTNQSLGAHMSKHSSERPYSCEVCGQQFKTSSNLKNHSIIHTQYEKKYICKFCDKAFRASTNMRTHERIHTGQIQGHCKICEKDFVQITNFWFRKIVKT